MSLIKANAVQVGQSPTATQNFTLAVPSSPDGTIKLARGNAGATTQDVLSVDASGNINGLVKSTGSTTARSLANRFADVVNVKDFGAVGNGVADDYAAFVAAIAALPVNGGKIIVPSGTYLISAAPALGSKSIYWDIDVGAIFTGAGTGYGLFPNIATNLGNIAVGPWVLSKTTQAPSYAGAAVNAATFEIIAPAAVTNGMYVGLYAGGQGNAPSATNDVWAANFVIESKSGSLGAYFGLEIDVISDSLNAITRGLLISGHGTQDADVAIEIDRNLVIGTGKWFYGLTTKVVKNAIQIFDDGHLEKGISIGTAYTTNFQKSLFSGQQMENATGNAAIVVQRKTDASPLGDLIRCVNAANTAIIFNVDASGNVGLSGFLKADGDIWSKGGALKITNTNETVTYFDVRSTGILAPNLPTSSIGLPSGALWVDTTASNVVKRVP